METNKMKYWPETKELTKPLKEVAKILNVHTNTVHRWIKSGKITYIKYGNRSIHFTYQQVQEFLNKQTEQIIVRGA